MREYRPFAGLETELGREIFRGVRLRAAGLPRVVEPRRLEHQRVHRRALGPDVGPRMLAALVLADRAVAADALPGIARRPVEGGAAAADRPGGDHYALGIGAAHPVVTARSP